MRGRCPSVLIVLVLTALIGCSTERVGSVVIEGKLAPELALAGFASLEAARDSVFCKRNLLQQPIAKGHSIPARFERLGADRYRLVYDLGEAPQAGFCRYTLRAVWVDAHPRSRKSFTITAAKFVPEYSLAAGWSQPVRPPEAEMNTRCRPLQPPEQEQIFCDVVRRTHPTFYGDTHLVLNVTFDKQPVDD